MVMPQMVLYDPEFYVKHQKEIDRAAEAWGYEKSAKAVIVDGDEVFIGFERIA